jgi:hypothetical protein
MPITEAIMQEGVSVSPQGWSVFSDDQMNDASLLTMQKGSQDLFADKAPTRDVRKNKRSTFFIAEGGEEWTFCWYQSGEV